MSEGYRFIKPESADDYDQLYNVMDAAFKDEDVATIVRRFVEKHPGMSHEDYFLVMHGEKAVAGLVLIPQRWNLDGVELKVAEMGCVGTDPSHRRKGLQYILNEKFDEYAREKGYDICVLAGIPYFYRQFGYQYAVELDYRSTIDVSKLPAESKLTTRPFESRDIEEAQGLLEITQSNYLVHSLRTDEIWRMQEKTGTYGAEAYKGTVFLDGDKMVAYYRWWADSNETLVIKELALKDKRHSGDIAGIIRVEAEKQGLNKILSKLSYEDEFSKYLFELGADKSKIYAWQVKILDPRGFLEKLGPVLERRLESSEFKGLSKELRMNFWKYAISLRFEDGRLVSVEEVPEAKRILGMNPYASIQLFLGYRSREELEHMYPDFYFRKDHQRLIDVLFPRKPGYIHYCY